MRTHPRRRKTVMAVAAAAALSLTAAGCGGSGSSGGTDDKSVTIMTSVDQPVMDGFQKMTDQMAKGTGITVKWQKVDNINQLIMQKIQSNSTPDIALIPQPGVVGDMVKRGAGHPLDDVLDMATVKKSMLPGLVETGTVNGKYYGLMVNANVKSLVFYNKKAWDQKGYKAPQTIDELNALTDQIKSDGGTPWCMGIESDTATGWPATDWFEDLVMRYGGADEYNKWVQHKIPFDSPVVKQAGAEFEKLMFTSGNVLGGRKAIASTNFGTAGNPMFDASGPKCWMYKQGSFITGFFPKNVTSNLDANVGVFGFPPAQAGGDNPVLGGGDMAVMLDDSDSTKQVMKMLAKPEIGNEAAANASFVSPHKDFDASNYPTKLAQSVAAVATNSTQFLFDGSDQMPGEVGAGSFWKETTAWISGQEDLDTALKNIDQSWPSS
jgi:alpha-glucoside transport system substrate-binding protein